MSSNGDSCNRFDVSSLAVPNSRIPNPNGTLRSSSGSPHMPLPPSINNSSVDLIEINNQDNPRNINSDIGENGATDSHAHIHHHHVHQHHYHNSDPANRIHFANSLQITIAPHYVS